MDPIVLIVTALAAGASTAAIEALKDEATVDVKAAYAKLRGLTKECVAGRPDGELALERFDTAPQEWKSVLTGELTKAGAVNDVGLIAAAKTLMKLLNEADARIGDYNVTIRDSKGVQVGDGNVQINKY